MKQITAAPDTTLVVSGGKGPFTFAYGTDMVVSSPRTDTTVSLKKSDLVFAGYGIVAPEYKWDDYAGLDVKGKTVVVLVNDPGHVDGSLFDGKAETYYGRWTYKYEEATRHGAAGMKLEDAMAAAAKPGFKAQALGLVATITLHDSVKDIVSHNAVGLVKGSLHPEDVVVYSAHWDHLGMRSGPDGKTQIFHGAIDNGSGIAGLLEIARVMAQSHPKRSVLFIATTSEEQGLLGAQYYVKHPLFPLGHTVADLNMDVLDTFGKTRDVTVRGRFMSGVDDVLQAQAKSEGLVVEQDSQPEKGMYFRADHFEFAKAGVPALSIALGTDYVSHPAGWGLEQQQGYTANRYHKPADLYDPAWDLAGMLQQLDLMYATGQALADSEDWPGWKPGTPFASKRVA